MKIKRNSIVLVTLIVATIPFLLYLVNERWGGGDYMSYFEYALGPDEITGYDSYILTGILLYPFIILSGYNPDSLILASVFFRYIFASIPKGALIDFRKITLYSFLFFPLHTLISLFPGKDIFSFGSFILLAYCVIEKKPKGLWVILSILSLLFRVQLGIFLMLFCLMAITNDIIEKYIRIRRTAAIIVSIFVITVGSMYIMPVFDGFTIYEIQERVTMEVNKGYINVKGYVEFPMNLLNLFYPLASKNALSIYSLLSIENIASIYYICRFIQQKANKACGKYFNMLCIYMIIYAITFSALWPNITDAARKIYPLTFCGSACFVLLKSKDISVKGHHNNKNELIKG